MLCTSVLVLGCLVASGLGDTVVINTAVDLLLKEVQAQLKEQGKDVLPMPEIHEAWSYKVSFFTVTARLDCNNGDAGYLTSIRRTGDAVLTTAPNKVTVNVEMGLADMYAEYGQCDFNAGSFISVSHEVKATVGTNSLAAQLSLAFDNATCTTTLDSISLDSLGDISVDVGSSAFEAILGKLVDSIVEALNGDIKSAVNSALGDAARSAIDKVDWCSMIPH